MISYLRGKIHDIELSDIAKVIVLVGDEESAVGYEVLVPLSQASTLSLGQSTEFEVSHILREDSDTLYGFPNLHAESGLTVSSGKPQKRMFERLMSVSGVGPKVALGLIGSLGVDSVLEAVQNDDIAALSSSPGLGKKTASKIILELRGKLVVEPDEKVEKTSKTAGEQELLEAIVNLGFKKDVATEAVEKVLLDYPLGVNESELTNALRSALALLRK